MNSHDYIGKLHWNKLQVSYVAINFKSADSKEYIVTIGMPFVFIDNDKLGVADIAERLRRTIKRQLEQHCMPTQESDHIGFMRGKYENKVTYHTRATKDEVFNWLSYGRKYGV